MKRHRVGMNINMDQLKNIGDATSLTVVAGTLMSFLPPLAALLTVIWTCIRIYETETIQRLIRKIKKVD
mgnify:FL=1|jgi:hypothetical protein|tara:strand:+ start:658 stop:864 length:207 start_codon:yes stop_codon:yes gene_type:complete